MATVAPHEEVQVNLKAPNPQRTDSGDTLSDKLSSDLGAAIPSLDGVDSRLEYPDFNDSDLSPLSRWFWKVTAIKDPERRFLTKLDLTLISAAGLGVCCRYLDQVNITNAFNSGMKEALSMYGNELNFANALWSAGYCIGQVPSNLALTRSRAPYYIAALEIGWTICTFGTSGIKNVNQLYVLRFFVGLFESGHFPAVMYVCSSYYKPAELAKRNTAIQIFTAVGPLFSGFLMAAVHTGLNNVGGWESWRWLFIICGLFSFPCAIWTVFAMPDLPSRARANWVFSAKEVQLAKYRLPSEARMYTGLFKWKDIKRWHQTWHVYAFALFFLFVAQLSQSSGSMIFWIKSYNKKGQPPVYTVQQINLIPLGINVIQIVVSMIASVVSDALPKSRRWPIMVFAGISGFVLCLSLAASPVYPSNKASRWVLYYLMPLAGLSAGCTWTMVNETSRLDPERRAYVSAVMNLSAYVFSAWIPILTFPTYLQPNIVAGNYVNAVFALAAAVIAGGIGYLDDRDQKKALLNKEITSNEKVGSSVAI